MERALHRDLLTFLVIAATAASCREECATKAGGCEASDDSLVDPDDSVPDSADADTVADSDADSDSDSDTDTDSPPDTGTPNLSDDDLDGYTVYGGDCDDTDPAVNPAATEVCEDGKDNDCDGTSNGCGPQSRDLSGAVEYTGSGHQDFAGESVAGVGDVNADGFGDLVIGAPNYYGQGEPGRACLVLGSATPASGSLDDTICYAGERDGDLAGTSVSGAGDFNGDGFADFVVGTDLDEYESDGAGHAYVVLGSESPRSGSLGAAVAYQSAQFAFDHMAEHVGGVGDVNGDGFDDVAVSGDGVTARGDVYLLPGSGSPTSAVVSGPITYSGLDDFDLAGRALAAAGDFDGDGLDDMVIGAPGRNDHAGAAYVVLGEPSPGGGSLSSAIEYSGEAADDNAGAAVSGDGDVNGDGYDDLAVGAYGRGGGSGAVYLMFGATTPLSTALVDAVTISGTDSELAGLSVSANADVDGDRVSDVLIGAPGAMQDGAVGGAAYLVYGRATWASSDLRASVRFTPTTSPLGLARAVSFGGDVNADGYSDVLLGAEGGSDGGDTSAGQVYLLFGTGL